VNYTTDQILFALGLTVFAGLSTGIGSALAFFTKKSNPKFLAVSLGFSAGVMIYVSMVEIFVKAKDALSVDHGEKMGSVYTVLAFFTGILFIALIDKLVPSAENPHEIRRIEDMQDEVLKKRKLMRMGIFTALAMC